MDIDTTKEREKLEKLFDDIETQFDTPRKVNLENHLGNLGGAVKRYCTALDVIDTQAAEIKRFQESLKYYRHPGTVECRDCQGQGTKEGANCPECKGSGRLP